MRGWMVVLVGLAACGDLRERQLGEVCHELATAACGRALTCGLLEEADVPECVEGTAAACCSDCEATAVFDDSEVAACAKSYKTYSCKFLTVIAPASCTLISER